MRFLIPALLTLVMSVRADWPQHLGPQRNGTAEGKAPEPWGESGLKPEWKVDVGHGYSGPVTTDSMVLLHHRRGDREVLEAYDRGSGRSLWRSEQPTGYEDDFQFDDGPRGTPAIADGRVFTWGAEGRLTATRLKDGSALWTVPLGRELRADKGFFGFACSPLVVSNRVIVQVGGRDGAGVVAVRADTGAVDWKSTSDEAGYASPALIELEGRPRVVVFNRAGIRVLVPEDGRVLFEHPFRSRQNASVNAASPLVASDGVFVTSSYGVGATWMKWKSGAQLDPVWVSDEALSAHVSTPVRSGGLVFGFHGRQETGAELRCVRLSDGSVVWSSPRLGIGSVLLQGGRLIVLVETGELLLADAAEAGWNVRARAQILGSGVRAAPALDRGVLFARDKTRLVAVRLAP